MTAVHIQAYELIAAIAKAVEPVLPPHFRGKVEIHVDNGKIAPENVAIQFRPPQRRDRTDTMR